MPPLRAVLVCVLLVGSAQAQPLSGAWCGIGEQTDPDGSKHHWTARMHLPGTNGFMEYPSLGCGGTLTFLRRRGPAHFYRERITYGRDRCIDNGLVAVEERGASVRWEWTGAGYRASALLSPECADRPTS